MPAPQTNIKEGPMNPKCESVQLEVCRDLILARMCRNDSNLCVREGRAELPVRTRCVPFMSRPEDCVALRLGTIELSYAASGNNCCDPLRELRAGEKKTARQSPVPS
jgi:hypothetical protein